MPRATFRCRRQEYFRRTPLTLEVYRQALEILTLRPRMLGTLTDFISTKLPAT
jgi:hypothetical protein